MHRFSITGTLTGGDHRSCFAPSGGLHPRARIFPGIPTYHPPSGGGGFEEERTGTRSPPRWRYPHGPAHGGDPGEEPGPGSLSSSPREISAIAAPGIRLSTGYRHDCPRPRGDIHHGPLHGEIPGENRARLSTGYRKHCPRPREGAGEEAEGRAGWGLPERSTGTPCGDAGERHMSIHRREARAGWGGNGGERSVGGRDEGQIWPVHLESMH